MPYIGNKYEIGDHNNSWKPLDDISSYVATFDGSATNAVSTTNNTIRVPEHRFIQGQRVTYTNGGGGNIGGLTSGTAYYIIHDTNNEFKLATSLSNANASTAINLSAVGSGTSHTVTAAFDGVNKKFKITYSGGRSSRFTSATQLTVAINNIVQRANDTATFTDGFGISDNEKIVFNVAPVASDIFWGSILAASLPTFDISDNKLDNFTGNGSTTDFTLSHIPANNESIIVTVNGVVQHPTDKNGTRAYSLDASVLVFTAAPANGDEIQVRHIGFAGATSSSVTGFYGRTGNVTLNSSADDAIVGVITATKFSGPFVGTITGGNDIIAGIITATKIDLNGDIDVDGHTNLDNVSIAGVTTAAGAIDLNADLDVDGHTNLDNVSVAGVTTFSEDVKFTGVTSGRDILWDKSDNQLEVKNNSKIVFGNSNELSIYHDGSDSRISNSGGLTYILGDVIRFRNHGDSGTVLNAALAGVDLYASSSVKLSTTNTGVNITGICTATDFSGAAGGAADFPNGLTGTTATFSGNVSVGGTLTYEDVTNVDAVGLVTARNGIKDQTLTAGRVVYVDSDKTLTDSANLTFSGSNLTVGGEIKSLTLFESTSGNDLRLNAGSANRDIFLQVNDSTLMTVRGSTGNVGINDTTPDTRLSVTAASGTDVVAKFTSTDANAWIQFRDNSTTDTGVMVGASGDNLLLRAGSNTRVTIDSNGHITPAAAGTQDLGSASKEFRNLYLGDSGRLYVGSGQEASLYHNGSNTYFKGGANAGLMSIEGQGNVELFAYSKVLIRVNAGESAIICNNNSSVDIYHDASTYTTPKLKTSATGVIVHGEVAASQDYPNYRPIVDWNFAAVKKLDPRITYTRTGPASYTDELGIVKFVADNTPRFDHDPVTRESKGLLIEPSRTNLFASSDAANSVWIAGGSITKTANTTDTKDPAGTYTACKLMSAASANSGSQIYDGMSRSSGGVQSLWAKKGTHNVLGIYDYSGGSGIRGWFDLNTGEHRCEGGSKVAAGVQSNGNDTNNTNMIEYPNGWYRCIYYEAANMTYAHFRICDFDSDGEASASSNSIYLWGLQAEDGGVTFATSHIPCNTGFMPGTVTRGGDIAYLDGTAGTEFDDIYRTDEGTFIIDWFNNPDGNHNDGYVFTVDDGTGNNRIGAVNSNGYQVTVTSGGSSQGTRDLGSINSGANKISLAYKLNDQATSLNGSAVSVDTSCTLPTGVKYMWFGLRQGAYDFLGGYISRIVYYPTRLPNNQLKTLSS